MAEIKWPAPTAYIVSIPMAEDRLWWRSDSDALRNVPLYTREQVEQMLRTAGVPPCGKSPCPPATSCNAPGCVGNTPAYPTLGVMASDGSKPE